MGTGAPLRLGRSTFRAGGRTSAPRRAVQAMFRGRRATGQPTAPFSLRLHDPIFRSRHDLISARPPYLCPSRSSDQSPRSTSLLCAAAGLQRHGRGHAAPGARHRRLAASRHRGFRPVRVPREASSHLHLQVRARTGPHPPPRSLPPPVATVNAWPPARCSTCFLHCSTTGTMGCYRLQPAVGGCRLLNSHELLLVPDRTITTSLSG